MKYLTKLVLCANGTWFAMADDNEKGRADIRRQFDLYVKHFGEMGFGIHRWAYPILPNGTHGAPTKARAWDVESETIGGAA